MSKQKGIVRRIDPLGRLVIPKEIRRKLDIKENDEVEMTVEGKQVIIKKHSNSCTFCDCQDEDKLIEFMGKKVCIDCKKNIHTL